MKHVVAELEGALLDAAVAKAEGHNFRILSEAESPIGREVLVAWPKHHAEPRSPREFEPSTDWAAGGPIIERERIDVVFWGRKTESRWRAAPLGAALIEVEDWGTWQDEASNGPTPLIAAMRAYVASKFGDEIELP